MEDVNSIIMILGWINVVLIPAIIALIYGTAGLRRAISDAVKDGKIDQEELVLILKESGVAARKIASFLKLFD